MLIRLIVSLIIITSAVTAESNSGIFGIAALSQGKATGDKTHYTEYVTSNSGDTLYTETLKPSPILFPSIVIGYEKSFHRILSFRLGLGFERLGNQFNIDNGIKFSPANPEDTLCTWNHKRELIFSYLTIPLDLKAKLPINRSAIYAIGSAKFGFLLSADDKMTHTVKTESPSSVNKLEYNLPTISTEYDLNIKDDASTLNMSLGFRIGGELPLRRFHILIESGYDFGLIEIMKDEDLVYKSGTFTIISLGVRLNTAIDE